MLSCCLKCKKNTESINQRVSNREFQKQPMAKQ